MTYQDKLNKFTFLIPIFDLKDERLENFKFVLSKIKEVTDNILVVEQVSNKKECSEAKNFTKSLDVKYLPVEIDDIHIHKSKLINVGTDKINTEFVWVNDSDCYLKFKKAIEQLDFRHCFTQPYDVGKYISKEETQKIFNGESVQIEFAYSKLAENEEYITPGCIEYVSMYGALSFLYKKESFIQIGQMNENYTGWGFEDNSLCLRMFGIKKFDIINLPCIHLFHPRSIYAEKKQSSCTASNIIEYEREFGKTTLLLNEKIRSLYKEREKNKIAIIGIERSGSTMLSHALSEILSVTSHNECFNKYGISQSSPFNIDIEFNQYQEFFLKKTNVCLKYLDTIGTTKDVSDMLNYPSVNAYRYEIKKSIIKSFNKIIILTRLNFLDWITSYIIAYRNNEWFNAEYSNNLHTIDKNTFANLYEQWYNYHTLYIAETIKLCNQQDKQYKVIDYDEFLNLDGNLNDIDLSITYGDIINRSKTIKQKKKKNKDYIKNYDEITQWFSKKKLFDKIYILTRFSLKFLNYNNHTNKKWLNERLKMFEECFKSIYRQTYKNYSWIIMVDPDTPRYVIDCLLSYKQQIPQIEILYMSLQDGVYNTPSISAEIKKFITFNQNETNFITLWHDSDDILCNENTLFYFAFQFLNLPVNSIIGNSIVQKDYFKPINSIDIEKYEPKLKYKVDIKSTCLALKSSIKDMKTIFDRCHTRWRDHEDIQAEELKPTIPHHLKYISDTSVTNFLTTLNTLIETGCYNTDKYTTHSYIKYYYDNRFRHKFIVKNIIELGVQRGGSIKLWHDYFQGARIFGIDKNITKQARDLNLPRAYFIEKNIYDTTIIDDLPQNIDIIIDDASHKVEDQIYAFNTLYPLLKPGGLYIIEDIQNLDRDRDIFLNLHLNVKIYDFRHIKNRYDDVIIEIIK